LTTYITLLKKKKLKLVDKIYSVHTFIEHDEQPEHLLFLVCAQNLRKERGNGGDIRATSRLQHQHVPC